MTQAAPPPAQTVLCEQSQDRTKPGLYITGVWYRWLVSLIQTTQSQAVIKATISQLAQSAAITTTAALAALATAGLYRVTWLVQITQAAVTSSSVQLTLTWVSGGVGMTKVGAAVTSNTTTAYDQGSVLIKADGLTDIDYATTYASNAANSMAYSVYVIVELIG